MLNYFIKNLSILKKFLFINSIVFIIIGFGTILYLKTVQPNLIKKKTANHIQIIDNTLDHIQRLNVKFNEDDVRKFLFSTRFLFQNLDRVIFYDKEFNLIGDTDTLDLDPRSFSSKTSVVEQENLDDKSKAENKRVKKQIKNEKIYLKEILKNYLNSKDFGKPYTYTEETYNQFLLTTIKNVNLNGKNIGYLAISENANEIRAAINERKSFVIRTAFLVVVAILIFGTAIAQLITIGFTPILSRIYTPEDFGVFAIIFSISSILSSIIGGRYEIAIVQPKEKFESLNLWY